MCLSKKDDDGGQRVDGGKKDDDGGQQVDGGKTGNETAARRAVVLMRECWTRGEWVVARGGAGAWADQTTLSLSCTLHVNPRLKIVPQLTHYTGLAIRVEPNGAKQHLLQ